MGETGFVRFQGSLDPRAQEFWPATTTSMLTPQIPLFGPLPLPLPPPPPPPLTTQVFFPYAVEAVPFNCTLPLLPPPPPPTEGHVNVSVAAAPPLPPPSTSPTRTIVLTSVPRDATEHVLRREMEVFGEVRGVQMERIREGIVAVHFYDLRHSERALKEVQAQHMHLQTRLRDFFAAAGFANSNHSSFLEPQIEPPLRLRGLVAGCPVWARFIIPSCNSLPDGQNQGTIVVFNLDPNVSTSHLKEVFCAFGPVKEVRETPFKKQQRFVEFYDIRDAAKALREMNGKEIHGKQVVIEFSRPGGFGRKFFNAGVPLKVSSGHETFNANLKCSRIALPRTPPPPPTPPVSPPLPGRQTSSFAKRFSLCGKGSNATDCAEGNGSIEASMGCLSLSGEKNGSGNSDGRTSTSKQQQHKGSSSGGGGGGGLAGGSRSWRSKQSKKIDTRYLINEDAKIESNSNDSRTTVMIKNIPNKYSQKLLLNMLDNHCIHCNEQIADGNDQPLSSYDFLYLPIDFNNKCNVGYGFVNMTSPQATLRLYKAFHHQHWEVFNSRKICEVTYARVQGLEALKEHFKNSKFPCEMGHYLPVVFSPPRDGRQLTDPLPIVGHHNQVPQPMILGLLSQPSNLKDGHQMEGPDHLKNHNDDLDGVDLADDDDDDGSGGNELDRDSISES